MTNSDLDIKISLKDLKIHPLPVTTIKKWLQENYKLYNYCDRTWNNDSCYEELPCSHTLNSEECKFTELYEALVDMVNIQKLNKECLLQLKGLDKVIEDDLLIKVWLDQNEVLANQKLIEFWTEWLKEDNYVSPLIPNYNLNIKLSPEDFKSIIVFLKRFNNLYNQS